MEGDLYSSGLIRVFNARSIVRSLNSISNSIIVVLLFIVN